MTDRLATLFGEGLALMLVEVRGGKIDTVVLSNTKTGRSESRVVIRYALEAGNHQCTCAEWLPAGSPAPASLAWKKGDQAVLVLSSLSSQKGMLIAGGRLERVNGE